MSMPSDQKTRELCAKVILAEDPESFEAAIAELKSALREHGVRAGNKNIHMLLKISKFPDEL